MKHRSALKKLQPLFIGLGALVLLPPAMAALGLSLNTASTIVTLAIAGLGLNVMVGYTGLTSFGHAAWFGLGAYSAALAQKYWLPGQILLPIVLSTLLVAATSVVVGYLILRRRGVYFSLLTLALVALCYTVAFRWTAVTGGEDGLGGLTRGYFGPVDLDNPLAYYIVVSTAALVVLFCLLRVVHSPFGHVLVAIRENQTRATFQGYPVERYKLAAFVLSAAVTGVAGALTAFLHYLVSAESTSVPFSGELLAMVVIGGMHHILGPPLGALFYVLFRELLSIWTGNWLFWFGLVFMGFVIFSPSGLAGIWGELIKRWRPPLKGAAAMSKRRIYDGLELPAFLCRESGDGQPLEVSGVVKNFGGIRAVADASVSVAKEEVHALIGPNGAGKTTLFNLVSGMYRPDAGHVRLFGKNIGGLLPDKICSLGLARSFQITSLFRTRSIYESLRLSVQARHPGRLNAWRDVDSFHQVHEETSSLVRFLGLEGIEDIEGGELSYGGQRLVDLGIALGSRPSVLLLDEPLAGLAAAERERVSSLVQRIAKHVPVLIVEHDIDRVLAFSQTVTVMNQGAVLMTGTPDAVRNDRRVQEIYTGTGRPAATSKSIEGAAMRDVLRVEQLNAYYGKSHVLDNVSLDVRSGEIVALLGRNGAGKSTLLKALTGLVPPASGRITFSGREITGLPTPDIARLGIGYVPQGRGLFAGMTVAENLALGRLARATDGADGVVWSEERIFEYFPRIKERMSVAADFLSGGEQQMVAVARALSGNVKLLLLDEPFEGLAPTVVLELFRVFDKLREHVAIVIVEHNLDLVLALADRVFALERGGVFHEGPAAELLNDLERRKSVLWL